MRLPARFIPSNYPHDFLKTLIIVPVVGAFLIDIANAFVISAFAGVIPALR